MAMESILENLKKVSDPDQATAFRAVQVLRFESYRLLDPMKQDERAAFARALAAELNATITAPPSEEEKKKKKNKDKGLKPEVKPKYDSRTRNVILQCLALVGGEAEVADIAKTLGDLDLREAARCALDGNPSPAATTALVAALDGCGPEFRIGAIGSLGRKGGPVAQEALRHMTEDPDPEIRLAAIEALSRFPDPANDTLMAQAGRVGSERARDRVAKARLRLAENLRDCGDKAAARRVYESIPRDAAAQRAAADAALKSMQQEGESGGLRKK